MKLALELALLLAGAIILPAQETTQKHKNLLGEGSDFEIGPHGVLPTTVYAYGEAFISSPAQQPAFDSEKAFHGKFSLKLSVDNPGYKRENFSRAVFQPQKLDKDKAYTLSAWLRADRDGMSATLGSIEPSPGDKEQSTCFPVSKEWKRYSYSFVPAQVKELNFRDILIGIAPQTQEGSLWIDDAQLEEGASMTDFEAPAQEFGASIERPGKLFASDEIQNASAKLLFRNNGASPAKFAMRYRVRDYWDRVVESGTLAVDVEAGSNAERSVKLPQLPCGYYRMDFDSEDGKHRDEAIFGVFQPMKFKGFLPIDWPLGCANAECSPLLRALGFGSARCADPLFARINPAPGKFDFSTMDAIVANARKAKMNLMAIFGHHFNWQTPDWALERKGKSLGGWSGDVRFPKLDAWSAYVSALVSRYKDGIQAWEVVNEPNCQMTPEDYAPYLQAAYKAAKAANPNCVVVGGCVTSDFGLVPGKWSLRTMDLVECESFDAFSLHMYGCRSPERTYETGTRALMGLLQDEGRKYGREFPIWHTEKSYTTTTLGYSSAKVSLPPVYIRSQHERIRYRVADFREKAEFMLRQTLIDNAVGKGPFFWYGVLPNDKYKTQLEPFELNHIEYDGSPTPEILAANGLARMLEGRAKPYGLVPLGATVFSAVHYGEDGICVSLWNSEKSSKLKLPDDFPPFKLYDFFGMETARSQGDALALETAPQYLLLDEKSPEKIAALLRKSEALDAGGVATAWLETRRGQLTLAVNVFNSGIANRYFEVSVTKTPAGWRLEKLSEKIFCQAGKDALALFPVEQATASKTPISFELALGKFKEAIAIPYVETMDELRGLAARSDTAFACKVARPLAIDGDLSKWDQRAWFGAGSKDKVKSGADAWRSPADLSCAMRLRYDDQNLYLGALVFDDALVRTYPAKSAYYSDSVEFFICFDLACKTAGDHAKVKDDFQFIIAPGAESGEFQQATLSCPQFGDDLAGTQVASKRFPGGYSLEAAIPWKRLRKNSAPQPGSKILMTFQVRDTDKDYGEADKTLCWKGVPGDWRAPWNWGFLEFK